MNGGSGVPYVSGAGAGDPTGGAPPSAGSPMYEVGSFSLGLSIRAAPFLRSWHTTLP